MRQAKGVLLSLHLKATMMKVSDPILFGHAVTAYYKPVFEKHAALFDTLERRRRTTASATCTRRSQTLPADQRAAIEADIQAVYTSRPPLAMVDSAKGITNLHVPSDVIIDASMPAAIRSSGQMWGPDGKLHDMKAMIPDRCYAGIYQVTIDDCKAHGAFDVRTMGTVSNVGLMAQAAEEYGSHDKTFEIATAGTVRVVDGERPRADRARRRGRRHLADVPHPGPADQGLGQAGGEPRPRHRPRRHLLAGRQPRLRPQRDRASAERI